MNIDKDLTLLLIKKKYGGVVPLAKQLGVTRALIYYVVNGERGFKSTDTQSASVLEKLKADGVLVYDDSILCQQLKHVC